MSKLVICTFVLLVASLSILMNSNAVDVLLPKSSVKLQYQGPLYVGSGEWEKSYSAPRIKIKTAHEAHRGPMNTSPHAKSASNAEAASPILQKARKSEKSAAVKVPAKPNLLAKASQPVAVDINKLPSEISKGLSTIFHLHDNPVTLRSPVKILDHV